MRAADPQKLDALVGRLVGDVGASVTGALIVLGDQLGLYKAMADGEPVTSQQLAEKTGLRERYLREWLAGQASAGYVDYDEGSDSFSLSPEQAMAFAEEDSPAFFAGDAAMLVLAAAAGFWSQRSAACRPAAAAFLAVIALTAMSYAVTSMRRAGTAVPAAITVDGHAFPLRKGLVLLYFFDPECSHCYTVAGEMAKWRWGTTRVVVLSTREARFTGGFLASAGLKAGISPDADTLRRALPFTDPPYAVALRHGKVVATFNSGQMEGADYFEALKRLGILN